MSEAERILAAARTVVGCWMEELASQAARTIVESASLTYVESPCIADEVRRLGSQR